jgi:Rieske Fe-S protein
VPNGSDPPAWFRRDGREFYLVRVKPREILREGGILEFDLAALSSACPNDHCSVRWEPDLVFADPEQDGALLTGWFRCPCDASTFAKDGRRVYGPAPTDLRLLEVRATQDGRLVVVFV